jgi:hypothetical protein
MTEKSCERCRFWQRNLNNKGVRGRCNMFIKSEGRKMPPMYSRSPILTEPNFYCSVFQPAVKPTTVTAELARDDADPAEYVEMPDGTRKSALRDPLIPADDVEDPAFYRRGQKPS